MSTRLLTFLVLIAFAWPAISSESSDQANAFEQADTRADSESNEHDEERAGEHVDPPSEAESDLDREHAHSNLGVHSHREEELVVTADPLSHSEPGADVTVISDEVLDRSIGATLGEVLEFVTGARNASFGQAVGRPVIHGMDGPRVRLLYDRTNTMDVSLTAADHPPSADPAMSDRIEILKGPQTLLFGSGASGGVINLETGRIPNALPDEGLEYRLDTRYTGNGGKMVFAGRADLAPSDTLIAHVDFYQKTSDPYEIPGCAESEYYHSREEEEHHDEDDHDDEHGDEEDEHHEEDEVCGVLDGSAIDLSGGAIGASVLHDSGFFGIAFSNVESFYGIPIEHAHGEEEDDDTIHDEEEDDDTTHDEDEEEHGHEDALETNIDLSHTRVDLEAGFNLNSDTLDNINVRLALSDYEHSELLGAEPETTFKREGARELRIVLRTHELGSWQHALGMQHARSDFSLEGDHGTIGPIDSSAGGVFWTAHRHMDTGEIQVGGRFESVQYSGGSLDDSSFSVYGLSAGILQDLTTGIVLNAEVSLTSRAPTDEELLIEGVHFATASHIEPNPGLGTESMIALTAGLTYITGDSTFSGLFYHRSISGFIYEAPTGEVEDGLPVFSFFQRDATFRGMDLSARRTLASSGDWHLEGRFGYDFVVSSVDLDENDNLPRQPPSRLSMALEATRGHLKWITHLAQHGEVSGDDLAIGELPSESYLNLRFDLEYHMVNWDFGEAILFLRGDNMMDEEIRPHTSAIKDRVPLPGRSMEMGIRIRK